MQLTLDKYNEETLKMLDALIKRNYDEAENLSAKNEKKHDEKIGNLHQFNSRLYYIKVNLIDMMKNKGE